jgi:hypothetical protein
MPNNPLQPIAAKTRLRLNGSVSRRTRRAGMELAFMNLDHMQFRVSATAESGVVSSETRLAFVQRGIRILGRYSGGSILRGYLVGTLTGTALQFRFTQREVAGQIHGGRSVCELERISNGRLRLHEHFTWTTRVGAGTNIFDQVADEWGTPANKSPERTRGE